MNKPNESKFTTITQEEKRAFTVKELMEILSTLPEDTKVSIMGAMCFGIFYDKENGYVLLDETIPD